MNTSKLAANLRVRMAEIDNPDISPGHEYNLLWDAILDEIKAAEKPETYDEVRDRVLVDIHQMVVLAQADVDAPSGHFDDEARRHLCQLAHAMMQRAGKQR